MRRSELIQGVVSWNNRFPLDRWWRIKHNVSFMSPEHRESSFIYQLLEFEEDKLYLKEFQAEHEKNKDKYILYGKIFQVNKNVFHLVLLILLILIYTIINIVYSILIILIGFNFYTMDIINI